jgi:hypothetical protein
MYFSKNMSSVSIKICVGKKYSAKEKTLFYKHNEKKRKLKKMAENSRLSRHNYNFFH